MEEMKQETGSPRSGIYQAMANVMAQIPAIGKEQEMRAGNVKYNFRGIDDVYNALQPLLAKEGIFVLPHCVDRVQSANADGRAIRVLCRMRYKFCHADGSSISCEVIGEALDASDKATNKAMSIAMKYALFQIFCIPTKEMADPDGEYIEALPEARRREEDARPRLKEACASRAGGNLSQEFFEAFKDSIRDNPRWFFGDVSNFLGRKVSVVSDLSDGEMREYMRAALN